MNRRSFATALRERSSRFNKSLVVAAILTIPTGGGPLMFLIIISLHRLFVRRCGQTGEIAPAIPLEDGVATEGKPDNLALLTAGSFGKVRQMLAVYIFLSKFFPMLMIRYRFEVNGKKYSSAQVVFFNERLKLDEDGNAMVIYDPKNPRIVNYPLLTTFNRS